MIENNGKKYYTAFEIRQMLNDGYEDQLNQFWRIRFPKKKNREVILLEQVSRVLHQARKDKKISYIEFTKCQGGSKKYYAFPLEDIVEYLQQDSNFIKAFDIKTINKE